MSEILCKKCGKPLAELDRGRYYSQVCSDCCEKHGLCPDCGGPVIITLEQEKAGFACSGWHTVKYPESMGGGIFVDNPLMEPYPSQRGGDIIITKKEVKCPKCGHKFEVSR